jgi:hypothetical protein
MLASSPFCRIKPSRPGSPSRGWLATLPLLLLLLVNCGETGGPFAPQGTPAVESSVSLSEPAPSPETGSPFEAGLLPPLPIVDDLLNWLLGVDTDGLLQFVDVPPLLNRSTGKLIRAADGGYVELHGFRVDIPAGALTSDTYVTIKLPKTLPEALLVVADFGPNGTTFQVPVQVTMPLGGVSLLGIDPASVHISHWDGSQWVSHGGEVSGSSLRANTTHFSVYGARDGVDTSSGG